jgi:hypothetical protein
MAVPRARALAGDYPAQRVAAHRAGLDAALDGGDGSDSGGDAVRHLAPHLAPAAFLES